MDGILLEAKCIATIILHSKVSFIQRCPLFRVSFIRGSTVCMWLDNGSCGIYSYNYEGVRMSDSSWISF